MTHFFSTFQTPVGHFSAVIDETESLIATAFGDLAALQQRVDTQGPWEKHARRLEGVRAQIIDYFSGQRTRFTLKTNPVGSAFQQKVWHALGSIPFGETRSYGQLAREIGSSPRAIGRANATNPICLVIPCHRVIGADGSLTGFAFGEKLKQQLLDLERQSLVLSR